MTRLVLMGIIVSVVLIVVLLALVRTRRLQERQAVLWLAAGFVVVILGLWEDALTWVADLFGIAYPPSALFLLVAMFLGVALLDAVITISRLTVRTRTLAQSIALLDERLERMHSEGRDPAPGAEATHG
jgi:hypothetical protein